MPKPKELKGIKQITSIDYIFKKCKCQVFIKGNDVWVKHRDYFSPLFIPSDPKDIETPLEHRLKKYFNGSKKKKFAYSDCYGSIVLRSEAWVIIENLVTETKNDVFELAILKEIVRQQEKAHGFKEYDLCCTDMERFWERVIRGLRNKIQSKI